MVDADWERALFPSVRHARAYVALCSAQLALVFLLAVALLVASDVLLSLVVLGEFLAISVAWVWGWLAERRWRGAIYAGWAAAPHHGDGSRSGRLRSAPP